MYPSTPSQRSVFSYRSTLPSPTSPPHGLAVYVFGSHARSTIGQELHALLCREQHPIVKSFFENVYYILRKQVGGGQSRIPRFSSFQSLVSLYRDGQLPSLLDPAVECAFELSSFINSCIQNGGLYPQAEDSCILGLGIGGIAAAAISSCKTVTELLPVAVHAVEIAYHVGVLVTGVTASIEPATEEHGATPSWFSIRAQLSRAEMQVILDDFSTKQVCSLLCIVVIGSAYTDTAHTSSLAAVPKCNWRARCDNKWSSFGAMDPAAIKCSEFWGQIRLVRASVRAVQFLHSIQQGQCRIHFTENQDQ
jgi:hypothetical protein